MNVDGKEVEVVSLKDFYDGIEETIEKIPEADRTEASVSKALEKYEKNFVLFKVK